MESSRLRDEDSELMNLSSEWNNDKPRIISRHNTMSRRFFPSNFTIISSTASSPGQAFKDEIDPSTYCFSTALQALQARSGYHTWECSSPSTSEGWALNSKWNEAEKYICNPLSGKVPMECLSSKSLTARSFRYYSSSSSSNRITMSAPLVFSSKPLSSSSSSKSHQDLTTQFPIIPPPEKKKEEGRTRDVGTQSTPPYLSSSSPSPASTPSIIERSIKRVGESSPVSNSKTKSEEDEVEEEKVKGREETKTVTVTRTTERDEEEEKVCSKKRQQGGCFSWTWMITRFLRNNHHHHKTDKTRRYHNNAFPTTTHHHHFKPC